MAFHPDERRPDPELLLRGYERAGLTINFIRALVDGGLRICITRILGTPLWPPFVPGR